MSKISTFRMVAALLLVVAASLIFGCTSGSQNGNQNQNSNQNQNQNQNQSQNQNATTNEKMVMTSDAACDEQNIDQRLQKVKDKLTKEIGDDKELNGRIKFDVRKVNNTYLEIVVEGPVYGKNEAEDLVKILKRFMKDKCAMRIVFVKIGTLPLTSTSSLIGFEWLACEPPLQVCPNGECLESCAMPSPAPPTGNANANRPANSNSNP